MAKSPTLVWLRRDLRLQDNPALTAAANGGGPVVCLYVLDEEAVYAPGAAQKWFLHHALHALAERLEGYGVSLLFRRGREADCVEEAAREIGAAAVHWNRRYGAAEIETDKSLKARLSAAGIDALSHNGSLLREPWELRTKTGGPYQVFTPFWKALRQAGPSRREGQEPRFDAQYGLGRALAGDLDRLELTPTSPDWASAFSDCWRPSEDGAARALAEFLDGPARSYGEDRNRPDRPGTSRLSPHLAIGTISPLTVWNATIAAMAAGSLGDAQREKFLSELAWREFSYHLLFHNPQLPGEPLRPAFARFPWREDQAAFRAWTRGRTGVPIVDAGMRELWKTGWMHNRVRMIAASFLVKNLLIPWKKGERWFWETLVDADPASNPASWQWVAGCGADAAPYFRIFNPVTQGEKFDPDGAYVRAFVPELAGLSNAHIHAPWTAPEAALKAANITLGAAYPRPIVDPGQSRARALGAYDAMRTAAL